MANGIAMSVGLVTVAIIAAWPNQALPLLVAFVAGMLVLLLQRFVR